MLIWNNKILIKLLFLINLIKGLPQNLDPFLEKLFETPECEVFISDSSFLAVSTIECHPFKCNFPYQLCMRPSNQYQNEAANNCRELPEKCLIAANEGKPLETPKTPPTTIKQLNITSSSSTTLPIPQPNINQQITSIKPPQIQIPPKGK
ncbi:unnamed protein product [Meloidogyne enterolobii]|uniref:Uncharacterized protein n=1 Tax=Meloidogyne enterolobii TaxID=390850 RepID=A0ACB0XXR3_MELEN